MVWNEWGWQGGIWHRPQVKVNYVAGAGRAKGSVEEMKLGGFSMVQDLKLMSTLWHLDINLKIVVFQSPSQVQLLETRWTAACQSSLSLTISQSFPKFMSIVSVMPSSHLILCRPLLCLFSIFPSIWVFSNDPAICIRQPKFGASASVSVLPKSIQGWFPLRFTGLISLQSKRLSRVFSSITVQKHQFFSTQPSSWSNSHIHEQ